MFRTSVCLQKVETSFAVWKCRRHRMGGTDGLPSQIDDVDAYLDQLELFEAALSATPQTNMEAGRLADDPYFVVGEFLHRGARDDAIMHGGGGDGATCFPE